MLAAPRMGCCFSYEMNMKICLKSSHQIANMFTPDPRTLLWATYMQYADLICIYFTEFSTFSIKLTANPMKLMRFYGVRTQYVCGVSLVMWTEFHPFIHIDDLDTTGLSSLYVVYRLFSSGVVLQALGYIDGAAPVIVPQGDQDEVRLVFISRTKCPANSSKNITSTIRIICEAGLTMVRVQCHILHLSLIMYASNVEHFQ